MTPQLPTPTFESSPLFSHRQSIEFVEEGVRLAPKFNERDLLPCVATDAASGEVLMLGWMNPEALGLTLHTGDAHYWGRLDFSVKRMARIASNGAVAFRRRVCKSVGGL